MLKQRLRKIEQLASLDDLLNAIDESDAILLIKFFLSLNPMQQNLYRKVCRKQLGGGYTIRGAKDYVDPDDVVEVQESEVNE